MSERAPRSRKKGPPPKVTLDSRGVLDVQLGDARVSVKLTEEQKNTLDAAGAAANGYLQIQRGVSHLVGKFFAWRDEVKRGEKEKEES